MDKHFYEKGMMKINTIEFIKFHLANYGGQIYRSNKEKGGYDSTLHPKMKDSGKKAFEYFKEICNVINKKIYNSKKLHFNQWQNSGNMIEYFWCQYKDTLRLESASSISLFAKSSCFYLCIEWDSKKGTSSTNKLDQHNLSIDKLREWVKFKNIDTSQYIIEEVNLEMNGNDKEYPLENYLNENSISQQRNKGWIRLGKKFNDENEEELINYISKMINELEYLYKLTDNVEKSEVDRQIIIENSIKKSKNEENTMVEKIENLKKYINSKSFIYTYIDLSNFYLSLKTKPFIILAGISGTGKSKLVKLFANAVGATSDNGQYNIISVKPDWNDSTELFGYKNINDEFVPGKLTEIIFRASKEENINKPYFICLDEMNLARVEYYLSEYLSIIESRELDENNNIKTDRLFSKGYLAEGNEYANLRIPENIYIVGTVNMDDTTFAFSNEECESINVDNDFFKSSFLTIKDALNGDDAFVRQTNSKVKDINEILEQGNKNFGYRVRDEIVFYMLENKINDLLSEDEAFDFQIMQKILPIITGSEIVIKDILIKLFNYCNTSGKEVTATMEYIKDCEIELKSGNIKYKKSAKKILMMLRGYEDGFTSFWA
ncbi:AAA family ATPase [Clostridium sp. CF011]|nr:HI_0552 family protein [Clostridium sp. CF011]MBU3093389.1 AAA family ATPase [Clostridium sp. CF011]